MGKNKMELYVFDIQRQPVSIHQPLARVLAGIILSLTHRHTDTHLPSSALRVYYLSLSPERSVDWSQCSQSLSAQSPPDITHCKQQHCKTLHTALTTVHHLSTISILYTIVIQINATFYIIHRCTLHTYSILTKHALLVIPISLPPSLPPSLNRMYSPRCS